MYHTSGVCSLPPAPCESALILPSETGKDILANQNMMSRPWKKIQLSYYVSFSFCSNSTLELFAGLITATTPQLHTLRAHTSCNFRSRVGISVAPSISKLCVYKMGCEGLNQQIIHVADYICFLFLVEIVCS